MVCEMAVDPERDMKIIKKDLAGLLESVAHFATRLFARVYMCNGFVVEDADTGWVSESALVVVVAEVIRV